MKIHGHCLIIDDLGNIVLDQTNDIHPGNMGYAIAKALANESNYWINSIAFGNAGCIHTRYEHIPKPTNDGLQYNTWDDKLYNEIYRIYLDQVEIETESDGTASNHPTISRFNRNKQGIVSYTEENKTKIEISVHLTDIPTDQRIEGNVFSFDEIGLFTGITLPKNQTTQKIQINNTVTGTQFFDITTNGNLTRLTHVYNEFIAELNTLLKPYKTTVKHQVSLNYAPTDISYLLRKYNIKLEDNIFTAYNDNIAKLIIDLNATIIEQHLLFESNSIMQIVLNTNDMFSNLNAVFDEPIIITNDNYASEQLRTDRYNIDPTKEASKLLTHLTFEPVDKAAVSNFYLTYTITVDVEKTPPHGIDFMIPDDYRLTNTFEYNSIREMKEWVIYHQLGYIPKVKVFVENRLTTDYQIVYGTAATGNNSADNQLTIIFKNPTKGIARIE